jgi:hypothetical protein
MQLAFESPAFFSHSLDVFHMIFNMKVSNLHKQQLGLVL